VNLVEPTGYDRRLAADGIPPQAVILWNPEKNMKALTATILPTVKTQKKQMR